MKVKKYKPYDHALIVDYDGNKILLIKYLPEENCIGFSNAFGLFKIQMSEPYGLIDNVPSVKKLKRDPLQVVVDKFMADWINVGFTDEASIKMWVEKKKNKIFN